MCVYIYIYVKANIIIVCQGISLFNTAEYCEMHCRSPQRLASQDTYNGTSDVKNNTI